MQNTETERVRARARFAVFAFASKGAWWGGYGHWPPHLEDITLLEAGEPCPQAYAGRKYADARVVQNALATAALATAGTDTRAPRWAAAWADPTGAGRTAAVYARYWAERMVCGA